MLTAHNTSSILFLFFGGRTSIILRETMSWSGVPRLIHWGHWACRSGSDHLQEEKVYGWFWTWIFGRKKKISLEQTCKQTHQPSLEAVSKSPRELVKVCVHKEETAIAGTGAIHRHRLLWPERCWKRRRATFTAWTTAASWPASWDRLNLSSSLSPGSLERPPVWRRQVPAISPAEAPQKPSQTQKSTTIDVHASKVL